MDDIEALELVGWGTPHSSQRQRQIPPSDHTSGSAPHNGFAASKALFPSRQDATADRPAAVRSPLVLQHSRQQHVGFADSEVDLLTLDSEFAQPVVSQRPQGLQHTQEAISKRVGPVSTGPSPKRILLSQKQGPACSQPVLLQQLPRPPAANLPSPANSQPAAARSVPASTSTQQPTCQVSLEFSPTGARQAFSSKKAHPSPCAPCRQG